MIYELMLQDKVLMTLDIPTDPDEPWRWHKFGEWTWSLPNGETITGSALAEGRTNGTIGPHWPNRQFWEHVESTNSNWIKRP